MRRACVPKNKKNRLPRYKVKKEKSKSQAEVEALYCFYKSL